MKAVCASLAVLLLAPQDEEAAKKALRIDRALGWLADEDADVREMGRNELLQLGPDAVAALEKKIAEKGAAELVRMLRHFDRRPAAGETWVSDKELREIEADEEFRKAAEKLSRDASDKYVYVKYQEAMAYVRRKNYQRAFDMVNGLIALEPKSANMDRFKQLRRHCENMITQTTLLEAKIVQPKVWYVDGEPVELSARMKNLYRSTITMNWEKGTEKEPGGLVVLDVEVTMAEVNGNSSTDQRRPEFRFEDEVPIAPGAQWEHKFTVDTSTAIADANRIRVIKVGGFTQPMKISADAIGITRKIQFEPALVKIIPKRYAKFLDNPWESFERQMAEGMPDGIYVCIQLLDEKDHDRAAEMLLNKLARSTTVEGKTYAHNLLRALTGQALGFDPKRWENWLKTRGTEDKDKKKK